MNITDKPLQGKVAIVTGANHGIGAATAKALARLGANVLVTFFRNATRDLEASDGLAGEYCQQRTQDGSLIKNEIEQLGCRCVNVEADLVGNETPAMLFDVAESELGPANILIHNASGWRKDSFSDAGQDSIGRKNHPVTPDSIDGQLFVDARAGALLMQEFISRHRHRQADWGRIVTLTSGTGKGFPGEVSYGAAKAALISYTLSAASEMAADGVTANVVYPPVTDTGWITDEVRKFVSQDHDHHHVATPEEVADVIAWLCAGAGRIVTGNIIRLR